MSHYRGRVLKITKSIDDPGSMQLELLLCLTIAWVLAFLCIIKGIKSSGKVMKVFTNLISMTRYKLYEQKTVFRIFPNRISMTLNISQTRLGYQIHNQYASTANNVVLHFTLWS